MKTARDRLIQGEKILNYFIAINILAVLAVIALKFTTYLVLFMLLLLGIQKVRCLVLEYKLDKERSKEVKK
jgi:hypothetical protein